MKYLLPIVVLVLVMITACSSSERITADDALIKMEEGALLVDVRTPEEYASGHIPDSVNIPLNNLEGSFEDMEKDLEIIVYCRSGNRSAQAKEILEGMGFTRVYDLGGIQDWPYEIVR